MTTIAVIQNIFSVLNEKNPQRLTGFTKQLHQKFFEVLVEESGYEVICTPSLEDYQAEERPKADILICAPFPEEGNLAKGFTQLATLRDAFPDIPLVVWSTRSESSIEQTVLEDHNASRYYTGTLMDAPDDFADMMLELLA